MSYPLVETFPSIPTADWLQALSDSFASMHAQLDSRSVARPTRTAREVRELLRTPLMQAGFELGTGPRGSIEMQTDSTRPEARRVFSVDAFRAADGVALEIDAGRAAQSNTAYRALLRTALLPEVKHLVLAVPIHYRYMNAGRAQVTEAFRAHVELAEALDASPRLNLPFTSITVLGW